MAVHDMLAEFGICCSQGNGEEQDGTFLKLAIKHLLALDMKLKSNSNSLNKGNFDQTLKNDHLKTSEPVSPNESRSSMLNVAVNKTDEGESISLGKDADEILSLDSISSHLDKEKPGEKCDYQPENIHTNEEMENDQIIEDGSELSEDEREELELTIDNALDQCFYCLYGLNLRSDSSCNEDLVKHKNTSQGDYQTKEQCAEVFKYILPYAKASSVSRSSFSPCPA